MVISCSLTVVLGGFSNNYLEARIGGSRCQACSSSPPSFHRDAPMIISIAMVKARGDVAQPALKPTSNDHHVLYSVVVLQNKKCWRKLLTRFVVVSCTWKRLKASQMTDVGMD